MSLFDQLPLHISEIIYKLSLKDHIDGMLENVYNFHLNHAKKRNTYRYIQYRKIERLHNENQRLLGKIRKINQIEIDTFRNFQDILFWFEVIYNIVAKNTDLIKKTEFQYYIKNTQKEKSSRYKLYRDNFNIATRT